MNRYDEQLPVDEEWADEHDGEVWTFILILPLYDLIDLSGIQEMNELVDYRTGVVLADLSYAVAPPGTAEVDNEHVVIEATGVVSSF